MDRFGWRLFFVVTFCITSPTFAGEELVTEPAKSAVEQVITEACPPPAPPPSPYKILFYENSFRYLDKPDYVSTDPFDCLKRIPLDSCGDWKLDIGGEFRWQGKNENNRQLDGRNNSFNLFRERLYGDLWYRNCFRVYIEGIDAVSCNEDQLGILTDENRSDLLNAFVELRPWVCGDEFLGVRLGRQELLFGEQRLISPLDWANTRRTFDSVTRVLYRSHDWDLDGFWGKPLPPDRHNFDQADQSRQFGGFYGTYKGVPKNTFDVYALSLLECDDNIFPRQGVRGDMEIYTVGGRWKADCNDWLWEFEGAYQFGEQGSLPHEAGMATAGCGRRFANCWAKPEIWFYYDWASGDNDPTDNHISTFNQQFPLGHRYFGFMDLVARSNIRDPNVMMLFYPCDKVKLTVWYHRFMLDEGRDALYNAAGLRIRSDPTGFSGTDVGDEIDLMLDIEIRRHCSWQFGYCHFCPGGFIKTTTATPSARGDAELLYAQFAFRF